MCIARPARFLVTAAVIAAVASCGPRQAVNDLDTQLLAFLRERDRLWDLPREKGGIRDGDVSNIVCPIISLQGLREIVETNRQAVQYEPLTQVGEEWTHQFTIVETTGFMRTPTLVIWLSDDGSQCNVGFRMYGSI